MKLVLAVLFVCFLSSVYAVYGPQIKQKLLTTENDCLNKTIGISQKSINIINLVRLHGSLPPDGRLDKFAICILQRYHVFDNDGILNKEVNKYYLISDDPKRQKTAEKCIVDTGSSNEETARKVLQCFLNTDIYMIDPEPRSFKVPRV